MEAGGGGWSGGHCVLQGRSILWKSSPWDLLIPDLVWRPRQAINPFGGAGPSLCLRELMAGGKEKLP